MGLFSKCPLLLALFIVLWNGLVFSASLDATTDNIFNPMTKVIIYNNLESGVNVYLHCKSKDDDLGIQALSIGSSFKWKFHDNFLRTTLFFCGFTWENVNGTFDIYVAKRDSCVTCVWRVRRDGVHGYDDDGSEKHFFAWRLPKKDGEKKN
ncbi:S-protein homolog 6-like [Cornus florida]|uniref:S-protein homolog 6-like n=1 Tax=Cornus florida TaxID=4283 RepID=UPI0028A0E3C7|nr:S-protein homolog 6-like [Cornus florida]